MTGTYQRIFESSTEPRSGIFVKVGGSVSVDIHTTSETGELPWYTLTPGTTKFIGFATGIPIYVRGNSASVQFQEVALN